MSMYYCEVCQEMKDNDWCPMVEHPYSKTFASYRDETCCDECAQVLQYDMEEAIEEDKRG